MSTPAIKHPTDRARELMQSTTLATQLDQVAMCLFDHDDAMREVIDHLTPLSYLPAVAEALRIAREVQAEAELHVLTTTYLREDCFGVMAQ